MKTALTIAIAFMLFFLTVTVTPALAVGEQYGSQSYKWADDVPTFSTDNIKVDCHPDNIHCVAIIWDDIADRVHVYWSTDYFQNYVGVPFGIGNVDELIDTTQTGAGGKCPFTFDNYNWSEFYSLPMDVYYRETDGKYWISVGSKMWTFVMERSPRLVEEYDLFGRVQILKIFDDDEMYTAIWRSDVSGDIEADINWLVNGSVKEQWGNIDTGITPTCVGSPCEQTSLAVRSYVPRDKALANTSAIFKLKVNNWIPVGGCFFSTVADGSLWSTDFIAGTFPRGYDAIWYYLNNYVYFHNTTSSTEAGIYRTSTTDFSSYSVVETVYVENNSVDENITFADGRLTGSSNAYQNIRKNNRTALAPEASGAYAYKESLFNVGVLSYINDVFTGANVPSETSGTVVCDAENYSYTDSGTRYSLFSLCQTDVNISLNSMSLRPVQANIMFDINIVQCPIQSPTYLEVFFYEPYSIPVTITDLITGDPVVGAEVQLDATTNITDSSGTAYFTVDPISNPQLYAEVDSECFKRYKPTGTPKISSIEVRKSGYINTTEFITLADVNPITNKTVFSKLYQQRLVPSSVQVFVHIFTNDLIELEYDTAENAIVTVTGANETRWIYGESAQMVNFAYVFPAEFFLFDDRDNYTITLNLTLWDGLYEDNKIQFVERDLTYDIDFIIPYNLDELPCNVNTDCAETICSGNTYRTLAGCISQVCEYKVTECRFFCDERVGCYNLEEGTACDDDRACLNQSTCSASYKSLLGVCGADETCKLKETTCENECNVTLGLCDESIICLEAGYVRQRFMIRTPGLFEVENYVDVPFVCGINNVGSKSCIDGATLSASQVASGVSSFPESWQYVQEGINYVFSDMLVTCDTTCNTTWEFCPYGCDSVTEDCNFAPTSPGSSLNSAFGLITGLWSGMFPTIVQTTIAWLILSLLIAGIVEYGVGGTVGRGRGVIFGLAMLGMMLGGSFALQVPFEVSVLFTVISGVIIWRTWNQTSVG